MARNRVERRREGVRQEIKDTARRLMAEHGTSGISVRAITQPMELSASAFYRYYPGIHDLITELIAEAFNALADTMQAARDGAAGQPFAAQLAAVLAAYRDWAVEHPIDFQLIYGNPIPGYEAPGEVTLPPVIRGFSIIVGLIEAMLQAGELAVLPPFDRIPPETDACLREMIARDGYPVSTQALYLGVVGWTSLHGIIMLELFNHLQPVIGDVSAYYRAQVYNLFHIFGVKPRP